MFHTAQQSRRGAITVLTAFFLVVFLSAIALSLDTGYLMNTQAELQRTADAAALAGEWELMNATPGSSVDLTAEIASARQLASQYVGLNAVAGSAPSVNLNSGNSSDGDIVIGYLSNPTQGGGTMAFSNPNAYNAVQVTVSRSSTENGLAPLFFAKAAFGQQGVSMSAQATAALVNNFSGFTTPGNGGSLGMLPFALDQDTWNAMLAGGGSDDWRWDSSSNTVKSGVDGIREVNLYPQGTGSPGNRGTVKIGVNNNSTATICAQILNGISPSQIEAMGGSIALNSQGVLMLEGNPGISAGCKDALASIIGQTRIIPIFSSVDGNGNNAEYTIVQFAGVRILDVNLTGSMSSKHLTVQPANVVSLGGIPSSGPSTSYGLYSPVWLVK